MFDVFDGAGGGGGGGAVIAIIKLFPVRSYKFSTRNAPGRFKLRGSFESSSVFGILMIYQLF